jgi:hypothetical protein
MAELYNKWDKGAGRNRWENPWGERLHKWQEDVEAERAAERDLNEGKTSDVIVVGKTFDLRFDFINAAKDTMWKVLIVNDITDAVKRLSKMKIRNLLIASHGGLSLSYFKIGETQITKDDSEYISMLSGFHAENIIIWACLIANHNRGQEPFELLSPIARATGANVYGAEGWNWSSARMIRATSDTPDWITSGFPNIKEYNINLDPSMYQDAGKWRKYTPSGGETPINHPMFLTSDGQFHFTEYAFMDDWDVKQYYQALLDDREPPSATEEGFGAKEASPADFSPTK